MSSVSIYYAPSSDIRVKIFDQLNFSRASVVQYWASWYIISPNRASGWKVMTSWILESFRCSILSFSICYVITSNIRGKSYDSLSFLRASVDQLQASRYVMRLNQTSEWKFMTILNFSRASVVQFRASRYIMQLNRTFEWKVMTL